MNTRLLVVLAVLTAMPCTAQTVTSTCTEWFEPQTDVHGNAAVIFGTPFQVPPMRVRFLDGRTGRRLESKGLSINYGWRWLIYPYPEHGWGAWSDAADKLTCELNANGWLETPAHEVRPRGWYDGKYTRWPWPKRPSFTEVELVAVTTGGFARVRLKAGELRRFPLSELTVNVFDGWRTELHWGKRH